MPTDIARSGKRSKPQTNTDILTHMYVYVYVAM